MRFPCALVAILCSFGPAAAPIAAATGHSVRTEAGATALRHAKSATSGSSANAASSAHAAMGTISALDLLELQIGYTTLLATYYLPTTPRQLASGARTGIAAYLLSRGIDDAKLPYVPQRLDRGDGGDFIDGAVLGVLLRYGTRLRPDDLVQAALAGETAALHDPYTLLFHPKAFTSFNKYLSGETFGGIGAVVTLESGGSRARVESVIANGPAERAGVRAADEIVAIDGTPIAGKNGAAILAQLRGRIGTAVHLSLLRDGASLPVMTIVRAKITPPVVLSRVLPSGEGYVQLTRFGDDAAAQLRAALATFAKANVTAMVLDLRGNGGGYGDEAKKVASAFIAAGPIFSTRERTGAASVERATGDAAFTGKLAVLVDGDTASASEIVAGALQDDGRATIVGTRTFGKGVVQSVYPLPDGAGLKITTARYFTPKGRNIDRTGITPDIVVTEPSDAKRGDPAADPQLARALQALR